MWKMARPLVVAGCEDNRLDAVLALVTHDVLAAGAISTWIMENVVEDMEDPNRSQR